MKLIDERGKLFGKFNLVDLLLLLTVVAVIGGVVFAILAPTIRERTNPLVTLTFTARVRYVIPQTAENVVRQGPGQLIAGNDFVRDARVVHVEIVPHEDSIRTADGRFEYAVDPWRVDLLFTIEARVRRGPIIRVGTQEVRVGHGHFVKTTMYELGATTESMRFS
jgi:hypothetical protein